MVTGYRSIFPKVAVLGTGTMGVQIAAHLVNSGCECLLFGLTEAEDKKATAAAAIKNLPKIKPPALASKSLTQLIQPLDYTNHLHRLSECSLVIEAVSENIKIKRELYAKVEPHLHKKAIFASNTSGLSIKLLGESLSSATRDNFCGVHFFNPPRYMSLVELIPHTDTEKEHLHRLEGFLTTTLGKQVVYAKDTPGFIGNRFGIFSMAVVFYWMDYYKLAPDTVDELCGSLIGRARSACFRTADVVGLDIVANVMKNLSTNLKHDPWNKYLILPDWMKEMIKNKHLGQKSGKGVYEKTKEGIMVFDPSKGDYRLATKSKSKQVKEIFATSQGLADALPKLQKSSDAQAKFLWAVHREIFHYAAIHLADVADNVRDADQAMMSGFGWEHGIFRLWQEAGVDKICKLIDKDIANSNSMTQIPLPQWTQQEMYNEAGAWAPKRKSRIMPSSHPVYQRQVVAHSCNLWPKQKTQLPQVIMEDDCLRMINLKDGVAAINFKTKMNTLSFDLLQTFDKALDVVEKDYDALVVWQPQGPFCAGANLYEILAGARLGKLEKNGVVSKVKQLAFEALNPKLPKLGNLPPVREVVGDLQRIFMRLKHSEFPVIAAVQGLVLGGGCELILHTDRVVAANDSFIGLVEMGIGVLPAGAGSKEMARRADEWSQNLGEGGDLAHFIKLREFYSNIAMAKVSGSALEAREMGYLRAADKIIANPKELLYVAKKEALALMDESYQPPRRRSDIRVAGRPAIANFKAHLTNMQEGSFISAHDHLCAKELANVICGGDLDAGQVADDEWFLQLERDGFINLLHTKLTQDRIEHILKTGKPLRN